MKARRPGHEPAPPRPPAASPARHDTGAGPGPPAPVARMDECEEADPVGVGDDLGPGDQSVPGPEGQNAQRLALVGGNDTR